MKDDTEVARLLGQRKMRRRRLAELAFEEKIEIVERLRDLQANRSRMEAHLKGEHRDEDVEPTEIMHR